jgi:hypothetical protein
MVYALIIKTAYALLKIVIWRILIGRIPFAPTMKTAYVLMKIMLRCAAPYVVVIHFTTTICGALHLKSCIAA